MFQLFDMELRCGKAKGFGFASRVAVATLGLATTSGGVIVVLRAYALEDTWPATLFHTNRYKSGQVWALRDSNPRPTRCKRVALTN